MRTAMSFDEVQIERYARHIILEEVGGQGQAKLLCGLHFQILYDRRQLTSCSLNFLL